MRYARCLAVLLPLTPRLADVPFWGEQPPHSMSIGTTTVYYHEMSSSSISRGMTEYKQCKGDVWVIYRSAADAQHLQFHTTNGSVVQIP
ncbi:MAG: hypothetical protein II928_04800 [Paludibacteraceae bacterium]|nr:hypothetical protein [Paludibacteraceae bacterium]